MLVDRRTALKAMGIPALLGLAACSGSDSLTRNVIAPRRLGLASSFRDAVGVNVHLRFLDTTYRNTDSVVSWVKALGVGLVRDRLSVGSAEQRQGLQALADANIKAHLTCGVFGETTAETFDGLLDELLTAYAPTRPLCETFASFGGPNEPNDEPRPGDWAALTRQHQKDLWSAFRGEPTLSEVGIVGPALKINVPDLAADFAALGNMSAWCDFGDFHHYTAGRPPSTGLDQMTRLAQGAFPERPLYCTEGGYNDGVLVTGAGRPIPEKVAAVYLPRQVLEHYLRRQVFFAYELLDDPDPESTDWQAHYGLITTPTFDPASWRPKAAYSALQRLLHLVHDPVATGSIPQSFIRSVQGGADQRDVTLRRQDGSQLVLLWRDVAVYDLTSHEVIEVPSTSVSVELDKAARVEVFDLFNEQPIAVLDATTSFEVPLRGQVNVCRVRAV